MKPLTRRLRAVTGMATKLAAAGYMTHFAGKWYGNPTRCCQAQVPASLTARVRLQGMWVWPRWTTRRTGAGTPRR